MSNGDQSRDDDYQEWLEHGYRQGYIKQKSSGDLQRSAHPNADDRPDYEIEDEIHDRLIHNKDIDASDIQVNVRNHDVTLKGYIDDKYQKRLAEDLVASVPGVRGIMNLLTFKHFGFQPQGEAE